MATTDDDNPGLPDPANYAGTCTYAFWIEWPAGTPQARGVQAIGQAIGVSNFDLPGAAQPDYVELVLPPSDVRFAEPHATAITNMQDGGLVVERRGILQRPGSISGTTGFLPILAPATFLKGGLVDTSQAAEQSRVLRSGFKAFSELRDLFRRFSSAVKQGILVKLHYMDFKLNDFWYVEPGTFDMPLSSRRPLLYTYNISFTALQPSAVKPKASAAPTVAEMSLVDVVNGLQQDVQTGVNVGTGVAATVQAVAAGIVGTGASAVASSVAALQVVDRFRQFSADWTDGLVFLGVAYRIPMQDFLSALDSFVQFFSSGSDASSSALASSLPINLCTQLYAATQAAWQAFYEFAPEELLEEANEMFVEVSTLVAHMAWDAWGRGNTFSDLSASDVASFDTPRGLSGFATDVVAEGGQPLSSNPFFPAGLSAVTDEQALTSATCVKKVAINYGETIQDVARRCLGSVHRFVDLVIVNDLQPPFIVANSASKPAGCLAWGEYIKVPTSDVVGFSGEGPPSSPDPVFSAAVTQPGTNYEVWVTGKDFPWRVDQWVGFTVTMTSGTALADPTRLIVGNTADTLQVDPPWTTNPSTGDAFQVSLVEFRIVGDDSPDDLTYGIDFLVKFNDRSTGVYDPSRGGGVWNAQGDLALVSGLPNYKQALLILMGTPQGAHPWHRSYGGMLPIGRPLGKSQAQLYAYFTRRSILRDPRTDSVASAVLTALGGSASFKAKITPVRARRAFQFTTASST